MSIKKGDPIKLVENSKLADVYYGFCDHIDELSVTATCCEDEEMASILVETFDLDDYKVSRVDRDLVRKVFNMAMIYRDRKRDAAEFELSKENSKMNQVKFLYKKYFN